MTSYAGQQRAPGGATAGAAVTQFAVCKLSSGKVVETTAATERVYGVAQDSADADGDLVDLVTGGPTKAIAGGDLSIGDVVQPAADGKVVADDGSTTNRHFCGQVIGCPSDTVADGDIITIELRVDSASQ